MKGTKKRAKRVIILTQRRKGSKERKEKKKRVIILTQRRKGSKERKEKEQRKRTKKKTILTQRR